MGKYSNLICMDLVERIEEYIEQKGLKPGDKLPSERDFCDILKVSRMTARDALKKMCDEGILYSYHGGGTFVSPKKRKRDISHIVSSSGTGYGEEGPIKVKIISVKIKRADVRVTRYLNLPAETEVYRIKTLYIIENEPYTFETFYIPVSLCNGLENCKLGKKSIYSILEEMYHLKLLKIHNTISIGKATADESEYLKVPEESLVILERKVACDESGIPKAYSVGVTNFKRVTFVADIRVD